MVSEIMNRSFLEKEAKRMNLTVKIVNIDDLERMRSYNGCYIIDIHKDSTIHWVGLFVKGRTAVYSDSWGNPPSLQVRKFVRNCNILHNSTRFQHAYSNTSGFFALFFLSVMNKHKKDELKGLMVKYINLYDDDTGRNEKLIKDYYSLL
jgi:hypothetical protein